MNVIFRISFPLLCRLREDLARPHRFAAERVGYVGCKIGTLESGILILANEYMSIRDEDYVDDPHVGATIGSNAIRLAITKAYRERFSMFHVHQHPHGGLPWFSRTDIRESKKMVPDFFKVQPHVPHGALVLSDDAISGLCWLPQTRKPMRISDFVTVGRSMRIDRGYSRWRDV